MGRAPEVRLPLSTNLYPGVVHPAGYRFCVSFSLDPWPTWIYALGDLLIQRELFVPQGRNMVVLRWRRLDALRTSAMLEVRPMLSGRDYHAVHHDNAVLTPGCDATGGELRWQPYADMPAVRAQHNGAYDHRPDWYRRVQLPLEAQRGLEREEDWWSPGALSFPLSAEAPATLVFTTEPHGAVVVERLAGEERRRCQPNQLSPLALCEGLLPADQARRAMQVIEAQLLTPVGLRTLAPGDPRYQPRYLGTAAQRDEALSSRHGVAVLARRIRHRLVRSAWQTAGATSLRTAVPGRTGRSSGSSLSRSHFRDL